MPYAVISSRQWPETRFEYAAATLEEAEALAASDDRLRKGRVRDYCIIGASDKKLLSRFQEPELRHLHSSMVNGVVLAEKIAYNELLNRVAALISGAKTETVPPKMIEAYRRQQRPAVETNPTVAAAPGNTGEAEMNTETTASATPKKRATRPHKAASGKTSKKAAGGGKGKARSAKAGAKGAAGKADQLGREGSTFRFMAERIMKGQDNATIAAAATKAFPKAKSVEAKHVAWCRWKLGQKGVKVPAQKD